jgi:uncharacterized protein YdaU (DUF1376 family)
MRKYYKDEKPVPLNSDQVARSCRAITLEERAAIAAVLDRFFTKEPDGWHNERADHEIAVSKTARANGGKGGRPGNGVAGPETAHDTESQSESETGMQTDSETGSETGSGHPSSLLTKTSLSTTQPSNLPTKPLARAARRAAKGEGETVPTWEAYSKSYVHRYGTPPIRDRKVNSILAQLVERLGRDEAPEVAAFYLSHNRQVYVVNRHPVNLLLRDAEGLRTDWITNRRSTEAEARQADKTQAVGNAFAPLIEEAMAATEGPDFLSRRSESTTRQ